MIKRLYDITFAVLLFLVSTPIMLFAAFGILISNKGPVIYKAKRVGKNGIPFTLYKFRTMKVDSGEIKITTLKNDNRVFPFGSLLRKSKIDELPQLINIILNQMSVVGPRPEDLVIVENIYKGDYKNIFKVKPGLTSPASLFDYTHGEKYQNHEDYIKYFLPVKLEIELYYVNYQSFWYDVKITFKTALVIIQLLFGKTCFKYPKEYSIVHK